MEEGKTKKGKGSTIVIILLIIIILGLVGYIYYSSNITSKETKKADNTVESTKEEKYISDDEADKLLELIPSRMYVTEKTVDSDGVAHLDEEGAFALYPYGETNNTVDTIDETVLQIRVFNKVLQEDEIDAEPKSDQDIVPLSCVNRENFDKVYKNDYNKIATNYDWKHVAGFSEDEMIITDEVVCFSNRAGGDLYYDDIIKKDKSIIKNNNVEIYTTVLFVACIAENSLCDGYAIYNDYEYKNELDRIITEDAYSGKKTDVYFNNFMNKYYKQGAKYKHTFKPNDDGGYYWYSTEKVE